MTLRREGGFSLIELMIAMAIMTAVMGAVFGLVGSARGLFELQPELQDVQQRLRVATDVLQRELLQAGAGTRLGAARGALNHVLAPVMPYRVPSGAADDRSPMSDGISLTSILDERAQVRVRRVIAGGTSVQVEPNCGWHGRTDVCGFVRDLPVLLFDAAGHTSYGVVTGTDGEFVLIAGDGLGNRVDVGRGAWLAGIARHHFWLEPPRDGDPPRLMHFDGLRTTVPVVDHVVKLAFEDFGAPDPPALEHVEFEGGPAVRTTYGPVPPESSRDDDLDVWGRGENCVFSSVGGGQVPRLPPLAASREPVTLTAAELRDGPWCPDASDPYRFDADLLRIRRVVIVIRVEAADESLRGSDRGLFVRPGTGVRGLVPDQEIRFVVTPRNLNLPVSEP